MRSKNEVTLIGHVGGNPETRELPSGDTLARFSLATNERYRDSNGEDRERTEWHRIVAFKGLAELVTQYVRKGDPLYVRGKMRTSAYTDREGVKREATEVVLAGPGAELNFLGAGGSAEAEDGGEDVGAPAEEEAAV